MVNGKSKVGCTFFSTSTQGYDSLVSDLQGSNGWKARVFVWSGLTFVACVAIDVTVKFSVMASLLPFLFIVVLHYPFLPAVVGLLPYLIIR